MLLVKLLYLETGEGVVPVCPQQGGVLLPEGGDVDLVLLRPLVYNIVPERSRKFDLEIVKWD
jgi:hypothetical protein